MLTAEPMARASRYMGQLCTTGMTKMPPWGAGRVQPKNMLRPPATAEPMAQAGMTRSGSAAAKGMAPSVMKESPMM